ncbi:RNA-guided endonuclease InsQ/TnpB family protein [Streptomyces libani]|uniref:RNA-guided endonuclease InsQ/TnpB family protein n=1 Tax=Streptomyces nigrescens TaxID=1920 RepID=UPI0037FA918F
MRRSYKFLLRPTVGRQSALVAMLADHCDLYNAALQERRDAWRHSSKTTVRYSDQSAHLKSIRAFAPEQARWSFSSQQATLRRLNKAFEAFFRRVKSGDTPGYPRFRSRARFDTVEFPKDGDGCRWDSTPRDGTTRVRLQGVGHVRVHQHRPVRGRVKTVSVKRQGRLGIANMTRRPKPRPVEDGTFEPNGAAAKAGLNRGILDAGWGVFLAVLTAKAECAGRRLIVVDPRNTSRTCPLCGHVSAQNRDGEGFQCTACGFIEHADTVGALNTAIRAGLALCAAT